MALFFFLIPFQLGKRFYADILNTIFVNQQEVKIFDLSRNVIRMTPSGEVTSYILDVSTIFYFIWIVVAVIMICFGLTIHYKQKMEVIRASKKILNSEMIFAIEKLKKQMRIH